MGIYCTKQQVYPHDLDMLRAQYIKDYDEMRDHMMIKCKEQSQNTRNIINEMIYTEFKMINIDVVKHLC